MSKMIKSPDLIDEYGPEHFIVCVKDEDFTLITLVMQDRFL
jgi:hypothetical protein